MADAEDKKQVKNNSAETKKIAKNIALQTPVLESIAKNIAVIADNNEKPVAPPESDTDKDTDNIEASKGIADNVAKQTPDIAKSAEALVKIADNSVSPEERREDKLQFLRNKPGGISPDVPTPKKGKGIFSKIGGLFSFFGKLGGLIGKGIGKVGKVLPAVFKILKVVFKAFGGLALFAIAGAAAVFLNASPEDRQAMIDKVMSFVSSVGEFIKTIGEAFGSGFMGGMDDKELDDGTMKEGLKSKFKNLQIAFGKAFASLDDIDFSVGGKSYKGIAGVAQGLGAALSSVVGFFVDIATGVANLISDPASTLARIQVKIEDFILGIGASIGKVFDKFFNMEFILGLLPDFVQDIARGFGLQQKYADERARKKLEEIKEIDQRADELASRVLFGQKKLDDLGDKATSEEKRKYTLMIERAKADIGRGKDAKKAAEEAFKSAQEAVIKEKASLIVKNQSGIDTIAVEEEIKDLKNDASQLRKKDIDPLGASIDASLGVFKQLEKLTGGKGVDRSMITKDFKNELADLGIANNRMSATFINQFLKAGREREKEIAELELQAKEKQTALTVKTAELMPAALEKATKLVQAQYVDSSKMMTDKAEQVLKSYSPDSGVKLAALEIEKQGIKENNGVGTANVVTDARIQNSITNNFNAGDPEPTAKVGRGLS